MSHIDGALCPGYDRPITMTGCPPPARTINTITWTLVEKAKLLGLPELVGLPVHPSQVTFSEDELLLQVCPSFWPCWAWEKKHCGHRRHKATTCTTGHKTWARSAKNNHSSQASNNSNLLMDSLGPKYRGKGVGQAWVGSQRGYIVVYQTSRPVLGVNCQPTVWHLQSLFFTFPSSCMQQGSVDSNSIPYEAMFGWGSRGRHVPPPLGFWYLRLDQPDNNSVMGTEPKHSSTQRSIEVKKDILLNKANMALSINVITGSIHWPHLCSKQNKCRTDRHTLHEHFCKLRLCQNVTTWCLVLYFWMEHTVSQPNTGSSHTSRFPASLNPRLHLLGFSTKASLHFSAYILDCQKYHYVYHDKYRCVGF